MSTCNRPFSSFFFILALTFVCGTSLAQVERLEVIKRMAFQDGKSFGEVGPYEVLVGWAHLAVDSKLVSHRAINDLNLAIPEADGLVRFRAKFMVLQPVDRERGNGSLLVDIPNRGRPVSFLFNVPEHMFRGPEFQERSQGDGFLMRHGFTLVSIGWQMDAPETPAPDFPLILVPPPTQMVEGLIRIDSVFSQATNTMALGHWGHKAYPVSNREDPRSILTVRDTNLSPRQTIPRSRWQFGAWQDGNLTPSETDIALKTGDFEPGKIYEAVYPTREVRVVGLGFLAVRDLVSYLRHSSQSPVQVDRTLAYGVSQTGRFLRHFLYVGMNADLQGRRVIDGVFSSIAGAGRGSFNHRYGQPSRATIPFEMFDFPNDLFPFSGVVQKDPLTGLEEGLLQKLEGTAALPKLFLFNTGYEYWGRAASLMHTTPDGQADIELHPNVRIYHTVSVQHGPEDLPLGKVYLEQPNQKIQGRHLLNPANYFWNSRALLLALDAWVAQNKEPPPSLYPTIADGTLVQFEDYNFPKIPGVRLPKGPYLARDLDFGPRFRSQGIMDQLPPKRGEAYGNLVPQVDADGNDLGGIRLPEVAVPLGTHASWNLRHPDTGAGTELLALAGAFHPFPQTEKQRKTKNDPRRSIEARYPTRDDYIGKFTQAAVDLINQGYLLPEDLPNMVDYANALWDQVRELNRQD